MQADRPGGRRKGSWWGGTRAIRDQIIGIR